MMHGNESGSATLLDTSGYGSSSYGGSLLIGSAAELPPGREAKTQRPLPARAKPARETQAGLPNFAIFFLLFFF